jgi:hypothetical protein
MAPIIGDFIIYSEINGRNKIIKTYTRTEKAVAMRRFYNKYVGIRGRYMLFQIFEQVQACVSILEFRLT